MKTEINKLALLYNSAALNMVTIPANVCKTTYSKLLGAIKPMSKTESTWTNSPNLGSKKAFVIKGKIQIGKAYK